MNRIYRFLFNIVYNSIPYGLLKLRWKKKRKAQSFYSLYDNFLKSNSRKSLSSHENISVISVEGLGFSGSGAVVDLLREYSLINCIGGINEEAVEAGKMATQNYEVDILRLSGGLFDIERYIGSNNVFQNQAVLQRFVDMAESFPLFRDLEEAKESFFRFFHAITLNVHCSMNCPSYNPHLYKDNCNDSQFKVYYLKILDTSEYRKIARNFLSELFRIINPNGKVLLLDQFCNDLENDYCKYREYVPNLKIVHVYRDPRDVYEFAIQRNVEWIAHDSVTSFIEWFKIMTSHFDRVDDNHQLYVRFEDLVNNYEYEVSRIQNFLSLTNEQHLLKNRIFIPAISKNNIGIWIKDIQRQDDFDQISSDLADYCYFVKNAI